MLFEEYSRGIIPSSMGQTRVVKGINPHGIIKFGEKTGKFGKGLIPLPADFNPDPFPSR